MKITATIPVRQGMPLRELVSQLEGTLNSVPDSAGDATVTFDLKDRWVGYGPNEEKVVELDSITTSWDTP